MSTTTETKATNAWLVDIKMDGGKDYGPHGGFTAIISDPTKDRDGERIMTGAFDPLPARIPVDINHSRSVLDTIGSAVPYYDGDRLMADTSFASTDAAQEVRKLMAEGHITGVSVMYRSAERGEPMADGAIPIHKAELIKFGVVDVPANPSARALAVKAADQVNLIPSDDAEDLADIVGATATEVLERLDDDQIRALLDVAQTISESSAKQAWRAAGGRTRKTSRSSQPTTDPAGPSSGGEAIEAGGAKTYSLEEAEALIEARRRAKLLDVVCDPDVVASQLGGPAAKKALYASLVEELAASIALVRIPDGVDYRKAATAAQAAVDALPTTITETPAPAPPTKTTPDGVDLAALATARAEVIANRDRAKQALALLTGSPRT